VNDVVVGCVSQAGDQGACSHPLIGVLSGDEGGIIECNTEKEYPMPHYDLGLLVTLDMTLILMGVLAAMIGVWVIVRHLTRLAEIKALLGGQ
jgi:hypothetical protein